MACKSGVDYNLIFLFNVNANDISVNIIYFLMRLFIESVPSISVWCMICIEYSLHWRLVDGKNLKNIFGLDFVLNLVLNYGK